MLNVDLKIGDRVRFLNEADEGIIKEFITAYKARVEIQSGFEITVPIKELVPVFPLFLQDIESLPAKPENKLRKTKPLSKAHAPEQMIVDLHIDKLREHYSGLGNAKMLDIQASHFRVKLNEAISGHFTKIIFIHGVGNGVLRQTIRNLLNNYEGVEYSDASFRNFGAGATEVRIISRNLAKKNRL